MNTSYININHLKDKGTNFINSNDKFQIEKSLKKIEKICDQALGNKEITRFEEKEILEEFWMLIDGPKEHFIDIYSSKKKRNKLFIVFNVNFNQKRICTDKNLKKFVELFENDNSEITVNKWISNLIQSWDNLIRVKQNFELITNFIESKLDLISPKLKRTQLLSKNKNLFLSSQGPSNFAKLLVQSNLTHEQVANQVGIRFKPNSYHSIVLEEIFEFYLRTKKFDSARGITEQINKNPGLYITRSKKKIFSSFILHIEKENLSQHKEFVKSCGFNKNIIGDPNNTTLWTVWEGGNDEDKIQMENARKTLNKWIISSFVDVFFNLLINDPNRKRYWLKKIPLISNIKIFGSSYVKQKLKKDDRIAKYVDSSRFKTLHSSKDENAGILMELGDYQIVEFTDSGALYCYEKTKNRIPNSPYEIRDLKNPRMGMASSVHSLNSEGRIVHIGNWKSRVDFWIKNYVR